ncbi:efflux RND transporter periplasmic adaptor subunit [Luteithermobacter gelatinilyticus]|uniref:efflux RND transporter periplasmic adaptor subunit n=1 Tax=Luteithermobacter gelatinilyticus TaxID=2582913 RepID=UPI00110619E2|nr:efflux RND transporter periplasmic adaptor subunit [Luteithermobacter gelatinilyticus]
MKNKIKQPISLLILCALLVFGSFSITIPETSATAQASKDTYEEHDEHEGEKEEQSILRLSAAERKAKGITSQSVTLQNLTEEVVVPGEVTLDLYRSVQITPRITAQVVARHAKLGDKIEAGQPLVTLTSVDMAEAQSALIVATREWNRVRELGRKVVSEQRFIEAQVSAEKARANVLAYGMAPEQVDTFVKAGDASKASGTFELLASQAGTVVRDDFVIGEVVEPGRKLFQITDESQVWVEAQFTPEQATHVEIGASARIIIKDGHEVPGKIVQAYHTLDETTRTQPIRIAVDNTQDVLHPGEFVNVAVSIGDGKPVIAVPKKAVILMDGTPTVFLLEGDEFHPTPIKTGESRADWVEVIDGLHEGDEIAATEVFLLKSLIQKSQMGEGHAH